jgi:glutamate dehydrogenase
MVEAIEVACVFAKIELKKATIAIQGFRAVGTAVAKFVLQKNIAIVALSDIKGAVYNPGGMDAPKNL